MKHTVDICKMHENYSESKCRMLNVAIKQKGRSQ